MLLTLCSLKARVYIPRSLTKTCQARNFCHSSFTMARKGKRHAGDAEQSNGDVKKQKTEENSESKSFTERISDLRWKCAPSIADFKFNKKRVRVLSDVTDMPETNNGVVYWMSRDQRVQDNWAMLYAQRLAMKQEVPLHVCFCLLPKFLDATKRHFMFMLKGLKEVEKELTELDITFHLLKGEPEEVLPELVTENKFGGVVVDFSPLRTPRKWLDGVVKKLSKSVPICQVDSHNVVPCWVASEKLEYGARTIRPKITKVLPTYLTEFPPVIKHPHQAKSKKEPVDWDDAGSSIDVDEKICEVDWAVPGYAEGIKTMESFVLERLMLFNSKRNDPTIDALSNISPWLHFGQVGAQRCILIAKQFRSKYKDSVDSFIEEAVVRRELADNFCYYNEHYDSVEGANDWAKKTLKDHAKDKREYVYTRQKLEDSKTHDDLWNAAQTQLVLEGKMHGFLRMYWAKKILEWTNSPEEALEFAIYLNDKYSMDGRDPNGYVGCMWSICGTHDQGWAERPVFGKIRYMNYNGCKRKFDVDTFVRKYKKMR